MVQIPDFVHNADDRNIGFQNFYKIPMPLVLHQKTETMIGIIKQVLIPAVIAVVLSQ